MPIFDFKNFKAQFHPEFLAGNWAWLPRGDKEYVSSKPNQIVDTD